MVKVLKMRVLGIDPGTSRWGFVFLEDGKLAEEESIPTEKIKADPDLVVKLAKKAQLIVAPSGYGAVLKKISGLDETDFYEILLKRKSDKTVVGLERVLRALKKESLNAYVIPGVKLLPTVPEKRKQKKIDMGTPDKLCAAVAGIDDQSKRLGIPYDKTSFILAEIGFGFDAFVLVKNGRIKDGIGGTLASSTWRGEDGEVMYLKGEVSKEGLRKNNISIKKVREGAIKDINTLSKGLNAKEILVSGSRSEDVLGFLKQKFNNVVSLKTCESSNAAYGAAIIADGLAGGKFKGLVELIQIKEAKGSNLDYVKIK